MANIKLGNDTLTGVDTIKVTNADDETERVEFKEKQSVSVTIHMTTAQPYAEILFVDSNGVVQDITSPNVPSDLTINKDSLIFIQKSNWSYFVQHCELLKTIGSTMLLYKAGTDDIMINIYECCFVADSKVLLADGTLKNISDIVEGDIVITYNEETKEYEPGEVKNIVIHHNSDDVVELEFDDHSTVEMRAYHPLLTQDGWKSLRPEFCPEIENIGLLEIGDVIIGHSSNKVLIKITEKEYIENLDTYNLNIEENDNYIVNDIVAHNIC